MRIFPLPSHAVPLGLWGPSPCAVWINPHTWSLYLGKRLALSAGGPVVVAFTPVSLTVYCPTTHQLTIFVPPSSVAESAKIALPLGKLLGAFPVQDPRSRVSDRGDALAIHRIKVGDWTVLVASEAYEDRVWLVSSSLRNAALVYNDYSMMCLGEEIPGVDEVDWDYNIWLVYDVISGREFLTYDTGNAYYYYDPHARIACQICNKDSHPSAFHSAFHIAKYGEFWFLSYGSFVDLASPYGQIRWTMPAIEIAFSGKDAHVLGAMGHVVVSANEIIEWARSCLASCQSFAP